VSSPNPLEGATLLISGGTGSFGNAVLRRFLDTGIREIRILSRDEKKQDDMRKRYVQDKLKFPQDALEATCWRSSTMWMDFAQGRPRLGRGVDHVSSRSCARYASFDLRVS